MLGAVAYAWHAHAATAVNPIVRPLQAVTAAPPPAVSQRAVSRAARSSGPPPLTAAQEVPAAASTRPEIVSISLNPSSANAGEVVNGTVRTSSNVATVEARIAGYSASLERVGEGRFAISYTVPQLPPQMHTTFDILFVARNTAGEAVSGYAPLTIR